MISVRYALLFFLCFVSVAVKAQNKSDSTLQNLQKLPVKYINQVDKKIDKYNNRIKSKTEKTLARLSKWENKIHNLLNKVNPAAAQNLFGNGQTTFATLLQKIQEGKSIAENYQSRYDQYKDKLTTSMAYLQKQKEAVNEKLINPINAANQKLSALDANVKNSEALQDFIKERKKQLFDQSVQYIGNSKYLQNIAKENYYYVETLKNYKEIFHDEKKAEQAALGILNKIPAFTKFAQSNSMLARLFGLPENYGSTQSLTGLQTRANVQSQIENVIAAGGPNAQAAINNSMEQAHAELNKLKDNFIQSRGGAGSEIEMPNFKPNGQKTKVFFQRLEYGGNYQFVKNNNYLPSMADLAFTLGYKLSDKKTIGVGASYKLGFGSDITNIKFTNQGIGLRSFMDMKLKKNFWITGGYEENYLPQLQQITVPFAVSTWQKSGLLGLTKKIKVGKKISNMQLLWDCLSYQQLPRTQAIKFRVGYTF